MFTEYTVVEAGDTGTLAMDVNELILKGWQPIGSLTVKEQATLYDGMLTHYMQAMGKVGAVRIEFPVETK